MIASHRLEVADVFRQHGEEYLRQHGTSPKRLGARIGFLAVLHTWGQNLMHHPHVHCVVPAGGVAPDGTRWIHGRPRFLLPVRVLSRVFRGKFIASLKDAFERGRLEFHGRLASLVGRTALEKLLDTSVRTEWVVYAKRPFGGPAQVLKYLARYTHRVAISNQRLLGMRDGKVTFRWKDYAHGNRKSTMTLEATEFIRRFLLHVLPSAFVRIRYYGFMANRNRAKNLEHCRQLLGVTTTAPPEAATSDAQVAPIQPAAMPVAQCCPACRVGHMRIIRRLKRCCVADHACLASVLVVCYQDTS
jgi:hypothetical protein